MSLLQEADLDQIRERLACMTGQAKLVHFTQELNLEYGREARQLLEELAAVSEKLTLEVFNFLLDKQKVAEYGIDKVPATVVCNGKDFGIRFFGVPAGYEFSNLLDDVIRVSKGESGLSPETKQKLSLITQPVHFEVFVTPT